MKQETIENYVKRNPDLSVAVSRIKAALESAEKFREFKTKPQYAALLNQVRQDPKLGEILNVIFNQQTQLLKISQIFLEPSYEAQKKRLSP